MRYWLVMPAAGAGRRFGAALPKQYAALAGQTVIEWALAPFLRDARCRACVVAIASDDAYWGLVARRVAHAGPPLRLAPGGTERSDSVRNALAVLVTEAAADDWVLVHDAARPCLGSDDLDALLEALSGHPIGGLLAAPCTDTMKRADDDETVIETVSRASLWRALTPQMFRYAALCSALDRARAAGRCPTDEAQALEWQGAAPRLVRGAASNLKITTSEDLEYAQLLLARRGET
jgi:2-C-methyl-D-erythritol 4-phosphate cytidylyltransferase